MNSDLNRLVEQTTSYSRRMMTTLGHVPPTLFALTPTGFVAHVPNQLNNEAKKDHFAKVARLIAIGYEASAVAMILESWMVFTMTPGQLDLNTPPSQSPNRVEVVVIAAESRQSSIQKVLLIQRDETGKFIGLSAGRFASLMPPKVPSRDDALTARMILDAMNIIISTKGKNSRWN